MEAILSWPQCVNMDGVNVSKVFSTMHEKIYIDLHNTQKLKTGPKFYDSLILQSQQLNCKIINNVHFQ